MSPTRETGKLMSGLSPDRVNIKCTKVDCNVGNSESVDNVDVRKRRQTVM